MHFLLSDFDLLLELLLLLLLELDLFFFLRDDVNDDVGDRGLFRTVEDCVMMSLLNSEKKSSIKGIIIDLLHLILFFSTVFSCF